MSTLVLKEVSKAFGVKEVLKHVSVTFEENTIYGLLGRNGAGKTTLIDLITGKQNFHSGSITLDGKPTSGNDAAQAKIYSMGEYGIYTEDMNVEKVFVWTKLCYGQFNWELAEELCGKFHIDRKQKFCKLSTGQSSIVKLIVGLCLDVDVKIFDEPVLGLDAVHRDQFYRILMEQYMKRPCTIVLSTHLIEEVSDLLERVIVIDSGIVKEDSSVESLLAEAYVVSGKQDVAEAFAAGRPIIDSQGLPGYRSITVKEALSKDARAEGEGKGLTFSGVSLNRLFIDLTKEEVS